MMKNLLFVCEGNAQRSPTFEIWFKKHRPQYNVRSTGTAYGYPERLNDDLLSWADVVYCMDLEQHRFISLRFREYADKLVIVGCSDQYSRESNRLFKLIEYWADMEGL